MFRIHIGLLGRFARALCKDSDSATSGDQTEPPNILSPSQAEAHQATICWRIHVVKNAVAGLHNLDGTCISNS